jgi:hypothetical protein
MKIRIFFILKKSKRKSFRLITPYCSVQELKSLLRNSRYSMDPNDRTLTISIENTSKQKRVAVLFGSLKPKRDYWQSIRYGGYRNENKATGDYGINIKVSESSHESVILDLLSSTLIVKSCYHKDSGINDEGDFKISRGSITGAEDAMIFNQMRLLEDCHVYTLNKNSYWSIDLQPKSTISIRLEIIARIDCNNDMTGIFYE